MFHSAGYFRGIVCPFFEHGLCHRPYCHYRHGKPRSKAAARKPPLLKSKLRQSAASSNSEPSQKQSGITQPIEEPSVAAEVKPGGITPTPVEETKIAAIYGSHLEDGNTSKTDDDGMICEVTRPADASIEEVTLTAAASDTVPSYAPEKCIMAEANYHSPEKEAPQSKADSIQSVEPPSETTDNDRGPSGAAITESDVFGSPGSDEDGSEIHDAAIEQLPTEEELACIEAEFKKVTATPGPVEPLASKPVKRKSSELELSESALKKRRIAHSDTPVIREPVKVQPPKTIQSNFSQVVDADSLYMGKKRVAKKPEIQSSVAKRPKLALTPNAKVPTRLRQKYLDCYIEEFMKRNIKPEEAYEKALAEEKQLFDRSSRKMIYLNLSTIALKKLREQAEQHLKEQRQRSDARVEALRKGEITGNSTLKSSTEGAENLNITENASTSKLSDSSLRLKKKKNKKKSSSQTQITSRAGVGRSWQNLEAELQASFSTSEAKPSSPPVFETAAFYSGKNKPEVQEQRESSEIKNTTIHQPKSTDFSPQHIEINLQEIHVGSPTFDAANDNSIGLCAELFGMSDDSDTNVLSRRESYEDDDSAVDQPEGISFESALTSFDDSLKVKKEKRLLSRGKQRAGSETSVKQIKVKKKSMKTKKRNKPAKTIPLPNTTDSTVPANANLVCSTRNTKGSASYDFEENTSEKTSPVQCTSPLLGHMKVPHLKLVRAVQITSPTPLKAPTSLLKGDIHSGNVSPSDVDRLLPITDETVIELDIQSNVEEILTTKSPPATDNKPQVPMFRPSGPFINLTKVAAEQSKIRSMAAVKIGRLPLSKPRTKPKEISTATVPKPTYTIFKKKEITLTASLFYKVMQKYLLSEEQLRANGYPMSTGRSGEAAINREGSSPPNIQPVGPNAMRHHCCRCSKPFIIYNSGQYQTVEECVYHFGRLVKSREYGEGIVSLYTCCQQRRDSAGCQVAKLHVTSGDRPTLDTGYVYTRPPPDNSEPSPPPTTTTTSATVVFGVDCEMCYTTVGLQLTRVSVIDMSLKPVLEAMVKPSHPIVDYNTRFSGLTVEDFAGVETTLEDIQQKLLRLFHSNTILLGHSLESDLRSLKLIHCSVVDTAIVFPHKKGSPYKRALKSLMAEYLQRFIQDSIDGGHDSLEDAQSCMELMLWKAKADLAKSSRRVSTDT